MKVAAVAAVKNACTYREIAKNFRICKIKMPKQKTNNKQSSSKLKSVSHILLKIYIVRFQIHAKFSKHHVKSFETISNKLKIMGNLQDDKMC